jgi:hypothetical protein
MIYLWIALLRMALAGLLIRFKHCFNRKKALNYRQIYSLGLKGDRKLKSIDTIALAAGVAVKQCRSFLYYSIGSGW